MRNQISSRFTALQRGFASFTTGQKTVAIIGGIVLLVGGMFLFRWAATPSYAPLYSNIAPKDASAVVQQLEADGTPYQLADGGATILVPRKDVYDTRIRLSGDGLPSQSTDGYALLDQQDLSTSQFQEQTGYKRAMEGELEKTIEALDAVDTAVVHIAMPQEELFADEQQPTTASVLVETQPGTSLEAGQVQAVVHLVASSVEGLDPDQVTVADSTGKVLSASGDEFDMVADTRAQQVHAFEQQMSGSVQGLLDRVLGAGNTAVQVTADLNFDQTVTDTTRYFTDPDAVPLSNTSMTETYTAPKDATIGGVVGPDGQLDPNAGPNADGPGTSYQKKQSTSDNAVGQTVEHREAAPGSVQSLHVGIVLDDMAKTGVTPEQVQTLVTSALGIDPDRGDTVEVTAMPFDRSAEKAAAKSLAAAKAADDRAQLMSMLKMLALVLVIGGILFAAWLSGRKRRKARDQATTYVVEQLRRDAVPTTATPAIAPVETIGRELGAGHDLPDLTGAARDEIAALVERQPEEVAQLLRGWLVDHGSVR
jgi:flagellar M-ring protein FliF